MTTLATLNNLRAQNSKAPLKAWKESKAKLELAIAKEFEATNQELAAQTIRQEVTKSHEEPAPEVTAIKASVAKASKAKSTTAHSPSEISEYFRANGINPKIARAKLRKAGLSAPYSLADVKKHLK